MPDKHRRISQHKPHNVNSLMQFTEKDKKKSPKVFPVLRHSLEVYPMPVPQLPAVFDPRSQVLALADVKVFEVLAAISDGLDADACDPHAATH